MTTYPESVYVSSATRLAFGREVNFSQVAAPSRFLGITNQGLELPDRRVDVRQYRNFGSGPQYFASRFGKREHGTSISFIPTTAEIFYYALGTDTKGGNTGTASDAYHVMTPVEDAYLPSMTLWGAMKGLPNFTRYFPGTVVGSFSCTLSENSELQMSIDTMSRGGFADLRVTPQDLFSQPTSNMPTIGGSVEAPVPYMFYDRDALIQIMGAFTSVPASGELSLTGGRNVARVRSFNLHFGRGVHPIPGFVGTSLPAEGVAPADNPSSGWAGANVATGIGGQMPDDARHPLVFATSGADFGLSMVITPAGINGSAGGNTDAIYDMIQNEVEGDILIPFRRVRKNGQLDFLYFLFQDCKIASEPHPWAEDRSETTVSVMVIANKFSVISLDQIPNYGTL